MHKRATLIALLFLATSAFSAYAQFGDIPASSSDEVAVPAETSAEALPALIPSSSSLRPVSTPSPVTVAPTTSASSSTASTSPLVSVSDESVTSVLGGNAMAMTLGIIILGLGVFAAVKLTPKNKKGDEAGGDRCSPIKTLLDQKKTELKAAERGYLSHGTFLETLKQKLEEKKDEVKGRVVNKLKNKVPSEREKGALGEAVRKAEGLKETYDDVREKYEKAKKLLDTLRTKREHLQGEVERLESSYAACTSGSAEAVVSKKEKSPVSSELSPVVPKKLFVDKSIEIEAPAQKVWEMLTNRQYSDIWVKEFSSGGPAFHIESNWKLGSVVLWKGKNGRVVVEGNVTALRPNSLLRFTVFDVREEERPRVTKEDGITYELLERGGTTKLRVLQGDFSVMEEGEKYHKSSEEVGEKVLPIVKGLAEGRKE